MEDRDDVPKAGAPGLHLHTSNRLETLVHALAEVTRPPLSSPFKAETLVVQSQGMARWLKQRLAEQHGICANAAFRFPNEMASELFLAQFPGIPEKPPFEREVMLWLVMKHLPLLLDQPAFADLRNYLGESPDLRKRYQLARKIAYLLDQYFIFRPEMVCQWDGGAEEHWQAILWRQIRQDLPHQHPAELRDRFLQRLQQPGFDTDRLPERLCIFGISALPPFHLSLFVALSAHLPVHLFVVQPSRFYWGDITSPREQERVLKRLRRKPTEADELHLEAGNRLLASFGPLGRDFLKLIYDTGDWQEHDQFTEPEGTTLLAGIQSDILNLRDRAKPTSRSPEETVGPPSPRPFLSGRGSDVVRTDEHATDDGAGAVSQSRTGVSPASVAQQPSADGQARGLPYVDDHSLQVHSCYSAVRELETLHDHLLDWFNRDPGLAPHEVVVMTPDIENYAPYVEAVFGAPEEESKRIPFRVADRGARQSSQVIQTFLNLLHLPQTRLGSATVVALLEAAAVRRKFQLADADVDRIRDWIEQTRIRWAADPEHRARLDLPKLPGNTWREGLDRLLLSYAMAGDGTAMFEGILPAEGLDGDSALVLGRFVEFTERLFATVSDLDRPRKLGDWASRLQKVLADFFEADDDSERDLQTIRGVLEDLRAHHEISRYDGPVELTVVLEQVAPELEQDRHGSGFLAGGVTFCALKPMRSIPFKVICLIGMNDAAFPRPNAHLSFDLMARQPRLGDRSTRDDDRYLFLETICSARERLYLSYVGQSIRNNAIIPPSVVISELLDYVEQGFEVTRDRLIIRQRLQAFHEDYFTPDSKLFSYSSENCRASQSAKQARQSRPAFIAEPLSEPEPKLRQLTVDELAAFFCNPSAYLLKRRLSIRLFRNEGALEERELFGLNARDAYPLKEELLQRQLAGGRPTNSLDAFAAKGLLPLGVIGTTSHQALYADVTRFWNRLELFQPHHTAPPVEINLAIGEFRITGRLAPRGVGGALQFRVAGIKATDILRLWIAHLALNAAGSPGESLLVGTEATRRYRACPNAKAILEQLLGFYWKGLREPLCFFPRTSQAFAEAEHKRGARAGSRVDPLTQARRQWEGSQYGRIPAECEDLSFNLCFGPELLLGEDFLALARGVFNPVLDHETVEEA